MPKSAILTRPFLSSKILSGLCGGLFKSGRIEGLYLAKADRSFWEIGEEDDGFLILVWWILQDGAVARRVLAEEDFGAWRRVDAKKLRADRHTAIRADFDMGAEAPDKGPPGAGERRAQNGAFFFECQIPGLLGFHFEFTVDFVVVPMGA